MVARHLSSVTIRRLPLLYTILSRGRPLGTTDLGFIYRPRGFRCGWLHPTPLGERLLPVAAGVAPAMRTEFLLGPDPTLHADVLAASDEADALALELRREDGVSIETSDIGIIDTPVVLGQEAANDGELTIYAGGEVHWIERARPALSTFGRKIIHVGPIGSGQIAKTMNNLLLWANMCANFEVLTLAKSLGADVPKLIEALGHGSGANWSLSRWGRGTGKWAEKDLDVALDMAQHAKVPMPLAGLVDQLVKSINQDKMRALLAG